jgi:hypothetical protein
MFTEHGVSCARYLPEDIFLFPCFGDMRILPFSFPPHLLSLFFSTLCFFRLALRDYFGAGFHLGTLGPNCVWLAL